MKFNSVNSKINKNCNKIELDKYYTSYEDMEYCVNKAWDIVRGLGYEVEEFLEPSAGNGVFSNYLATSGLDVIAIDIKPEDEDIIKADFLTYELEYKKGRFIIGNPPYGARLNLAQKFYKKAIKIGDYIAFILPISQLNNTQFMYEFDLVHSEDLGKLTFSNKKKVHCCLNVYVRPKDGLNKRKPNRLKDVEIVRQDSKKYKEFEYDIRMCYWGDATAGKILSEGESYSGEYKIKIYNEELKEDVINVLTNTDWKKEINSTAMRRIKQSHIIDVLKKYIPNIK
jgi:predicted RNA methylase